VPGKHKVTKLGQQVVNAEKNLIFCGASAAASMGPVMEQGFYTIALFQCGSTCKEELLVPIPQLAYRRGNRKRGLAPMAGRAAGGRKSSSLEGRMAGVLSDEIDVLSKARRAMPGDYFPSDDEPYMRRSLSCQPLQARFPRCRMARSVNPISMTALRVKPSGASNCAPGIGSAS
jgi:hypothetical protein